MSDNEPVTNAPKPEGTTSGNADLGSSSFSSPLPLAGKPSEAPDLRLVNLEQQPAIDLREASLSGVLGRPTERDSRLTMPAANFYHAAPDPTLNHVTDADMNHAAMAGLEVARLALENMGRRVAESSAAVIEAWQRHKGEAQPAEPGALALAKVREMKDGVLARIGEMAAGNSGPVDNVNLLSPGRLSSVAVQQAAADYLERAA